VTDPSAQPPSVVSAIVGDRLCVKCGFNLTGQPVLREPHYQLLISRCPECGTAAPLQEYPLLGRWANRWAAALAACWLLLLLVWVIGIGFAVWGLSLGAAELGAERFDDVIEIAYDEWAAASAPQAGAAHSTGAPAPPNPPVLPGARLRTHYAGVPAMDRAWWNGVDRAALLQSAGGFRRAVAPDGFIPMLPLVLMCFLLGAAGSVAMLHLRGVRLALVALAPVAIALALAAATVAVRSAHIRAAPFLDSEDAAWQIVGPRIHALALALAFVALAAGLVSGRPLVRRAARALLPPRLCNSLSLLWLTDKRPLPRPARKSQPRRDRASHAERAESIPTQPAAADQRSSRLS